MRSYPCLDGRLLFWGLSGPCNAVDIFTQQWSRVSDAPGGSLVTCLRCGLTQRLLVPPRGCRSCCSACHAEFLRPRARGAIAGSAACALGALLLYPAAVLLAVIELTKFGHAHPVTVWSGAVDLITSGQPGVGVLVFLCSIVIPVLKIVGIIALDVDRSWRRAGARRLAHRLIDWIGRWSMLDVLLVALLVAAIKLGNWANIHPGPGAAAFASMVVLSMTASALFKPPPGVAS